jgi:hypothetical protein
MNYEMKYAFRSAVNLKIFDINGKEITSLDTIREHNLYIDENSSAILVKDALFDLKLLKFLGKEKNSHNNDYEKCLKNNVTTIVFNKESNKKCKLIANCLWRRADNGEDVSCVYEIPNAITTNNIKFESSNYGDPSTNDLIFKIEPYNEYGDLFKLHITE